MTLEITIITQDGKKVKYNNLAEALKRTRIDAGFSQEQLAERLGIIVQNLQKYEYGQRNPKDDMLQRFAETLGVDIYVLTTFSGS